MLSLSGDWNLQDWKMTEWNLADWNSSPCNFVRQFPVPQMQLSLSVAAPKVFL